MKQIIFIILIVMGLYFSPTVWSGEIGPYDKSNAQEDGRLISEMVKNFNRPEKDLVAYGVMTLKNGKSISDTRKVVTKQKSYNELSRFLFRFMDGTKRGLTFMTIETTGQYDDQYLFAPAIGRPRQVASQDRQNNFEDTDLTNEDLGGIKLDAYTYKRGKDKKIADRVCYKVTVRAKDKTARYPKRVTWVDKENFVPVQAKVYNRDNKLALVMVAGDIRNISGIYIPFKIVAKDLIKDHTTILQVSKAEVNTGIDNLPFNKDTMGGAWIEQY
jgi:outer membrane lipoprotein-sorting protein